MVAAVVELSVVAAIQRDLAVVAEADPVLASSGLAAAALAMAREIDLASNSASSKSACARALGEIMGRIRELAPAAESADQVSGLADRARRKLAGAGS